MSLIKTIRTQLGMSTTPTSNFTLDASADNGTMKLARGNAGATTQDIMTVAADGKVNFPQGFGATAPYVLKAGDTMTGGLIVANDNGVAVRRTGGTIAAALVVNAGEASSSLYHGPAAPFRFNDVTVAFGGANLNNSYDATFAKSISIKDGNGVRLVEPTGNNVFDIKYGGTYLGFGSNGVDRAFIYPDGQFRVPYIGSATGTDICLDGSGYIKLGTSARRFKENIEPIDAGLDFVNAMVPVKYTMIDDGSPQVGFIADDCPDNRLVNYSRIDPTDENSPLQVQSFRYSNYTAILTKAVQELSAKLDAALARIAELEAK